MFRRKKAATISGRIVLPLLITTVFQSFIVISMLMANGVFDQLQENALDLLEERTQNKYQSLETEMNINWSYLSSTKEKIHGTVEALLRSRDQRYADIRTDPALNAALSQAVTPDLVACLRANNTTGVFLVLDGIGVVGRPETYAGVYVRDTDPLADAADNSDLHVLRALPPLTRALSLSLDSFWQASFVFPGGSDNPDNDYFYKPLVAAREGKSSEQLHDGYWSPTFYINGKDDSAVVTYSEPLLNKNGEVYGVLGVELNEDYLVSLLNKGEFARSNRGCYFLGWTTDGGATYNRVTTGGVKYKQYFRAEDTVLRPVEQTEDGRIRVQSTRAIETLRGTVFPLTLYPSNTALIAQQWVLIGLEDEATLFTFARTIRDLIVLAAALAMIVGVSVSLLIGRGIVSPIIRLVDSLEKSDPNETLSLTKTGILEIDRLADAILTLNRDAQEAANKLSKILKLAGLSVGVYEIRNDSDSAYCSDGVYQLLGRTDLSGRNNLLPKLSCEAMIAKAMADPVEDAVYRLTVGGAERFVRVKQMQGQHGTVGTVIDVTSEMADRRRIERERDHDLLTGILNRRAFESTAERLFMHKGGALGIAAVIMLDLDNLKYLNDTYGHDCGDGYIRSFAESLRLFGTEKTLLARRSGDEFYVLLYGAQSREQLQDSIAHAWRGIQARTYQLPDGTPYKMRVSAGVAWYPDDAVTLAQLVHYADFAMYKVKRTAKGTFEEFDRKGYNEDSYLISGRDALDRLIDQQLVRFALQPILSARTGEVYGYELLMRTNVRELPDPTTVLRLANVEGKLQHIEHLTWFKGLETIKALMTNRATPSDALFFLNSIANQALSSEDELSVINRFAGLLSRLVVEVTEGEKNDKSCTQKKLAFVHRLGGKIAIDDYGTGYNSEMALMQIDADIVKLDISFVHGVDVDGNKQALIQNLISYAKQRGIAVLAEGVETREEMRTLIRFGVDYLQGYYLGQPQYQPMNPDKLLKREIRRIAGEAEGLDEA